MSRDSRVKLTLGERAHRLALLLSLATSAFAGLFVAGAQAATFEFPSSSSTVVSAGSAPPGSVGSFWSQTHKVEQSFSGPPSIDHAALSVQPVSNSLLPGAQIEWILSINGTDIGTLTVTSGATAPIVLSTSFPPMAGPTYVVELRANNDVPPGRGSIFLASTGSSGSHSLELSDEAPDTHLSDGPPPVTTGTSATFTFDSAQPDLAGFRCSIDHTNFVPCVSPKTYYAFAVGAHSFEVSAVDTAGNADATPAISTWTIAAPADTTPPDTSITDGPAATTASTTASFIFSSTESGSSFECKLDAGAFEPCSRPKGYSGLGKGAHTFAVRAVDAAANVGASSTWRWTITSNPGNVDTAPADQTAKKKREPKAHRCRKGFRKAKRHGKSICVKKKQQHRNLRHRH